MNIIFSHPLFGIVISIIAFQIGILVSRLLRSPLVNTFLVAVIVIITFLRIFGIPLDQYLVGGNMISLFLAPATAVLAVSIYRQFAILKQYFWPLIVGCFVGSITSMTSVVLLCRLFGLDRQIEASLIPKSVTTAIAIEISRTRGGIIAVTMVGVLLTGITGAMLAPKLIKLLRIHDPVIAGVAIGVSSHAIGTTKAIELGEIQGAMSGLSIGVAGLMTALLTLLF
jgi:predicted murein hydrolase (TIGR00659 family)